YRGGGVDRATGTSRSSKHKLERTVRAEFLDTIIAPVGNVDLPIVIHRNPPGHVEFARTSAAFAPLVHELAVPGEFLHAVVHGIHHVEMALTIKGQSGGAVGLP